MALTIIGAGSVGLALGKAFAAKGEQVYFGVTDVRKYVPVIKPLPGIRLMDVPAAVAETDLAILAVPYAAAAAVARSIPDWGGRVLVDATNPLAPGLAGLALGTTTSAAEETARAANNARVVKAFNTTGAENMADSTYPAGRVFMPVCGDDAAARARVVALADLIGFEGVDFGPLAAARYLEPFAMAWIHLAYKQGMGRRFAFGLLKR
jgi:predicted dinucleotide-binding enzyme